MPSITPQQALPALRLAIGAGAFAFPDLTGTIFGFNIKDNHEAVYMGRLFGARDVALGVGVLAAKGDGKRLWWQLGILCDAADAAAGILGLKAGAPKRGHIMATATALSAVGIGIAALAQPGPESENSAPA
ncbi:MAG: hypothetical protein M3Z06_03690 [Actinomycetota bacterium]|nr:hypothetical protein [Actinomycetota bacterium]